MTRTECKLAWQGRVANGNCKDGLKAQWLPQPRANALGKRIQNPNNAPCKGNCKNEGLLQLPLQGALS